MFETPLSLLPRLVFPSGPAGPDQPWWNTQRGSAMPFHRYRRTPAVRVPDHRDWPGRTVDRAPLWASVDLRDGNQSLANPMDIRRKTMLFDLLVRMGFKDIEVGYPSASEADFSFLRELITGDRIPDDVTISVFTPARPELIDRTFEAIEGADQAMVHLCHATACLWREVVFQMTTTDVERMAVMAAEHVLRRADAAGRTRLRFEYSPETFNITEPEYVLGLSNTVAALWDASPDRPVTLNLPTTVETDHPHVFADQIEWMHRNLERRESIILSVHPHNDRGTAVASAELAVLAGADRIEGTLFGNGERTGNVCLATLALNLFSQGVDPQLDFSDIDGIRRTVEAANQMPVPARHPYAGDLVYTAFSGTHQDAISKGLRAMARRAEEAGEPESRTTWQVPYLPIDPKDVGRDYEEVVRVNSQSGRGGITHVLRGSYGLDLPRELSRELAERVQRAADRDGRELNSRRLWEIFSTEYLEPADPYLTLKDYEVSHGPAGTDLRALVTVRGGTELALSGSGADPAVALARALTAAGIPADLLDLTQHPLTGGERPRTPAGPASRTASRTAAYAQLAAGGRTWWGAALADRPDGAVLRAVVSVLNRVHA